MNKSILIFGLLLLPGCAANKDFSKTQNTAPAEKSITLSQLSYHDGILEGQVLNTSERTAQVIIIEVSFFDPAGKPMFSQEFKAVPGGDGHAILPRQAKHFNYTVALNTNSVKIDVSGRIKSVSYAP